ncbi:MAG: hypothetical protein NDF55_04200 [archaeon GB-1867-005]|nr:hypothetical protein [Candidatus Culexmicrobium cathedralense]
MKRDFLLGKCVSFPKYSHYTAHYSTVQDIKYIKRAIVKALKSIDGKRDRIILSIAGRMGEVNGERIFQVKVADGNKFKKINSNILRILINSVVDNILNFIDFEVKIRYRYLDENGRRRSSWSDRYLVRVYFTELTFKIQISHIGGLRRFTPRELGKMIYLALVQNLRKMGIRPSIRKIYELS